MITKFNLTKRLYEKNFTSEIIRGLFNFIDSIIHLPQLLEIEYKNSLYQLEEAAHMNYVSSIEIMGIEKGIEQGFQQKSKEIAQRMIKKGFSTVLISDLTGLDENQINSLKKEELVA